MGTEYRVKWKREGLSPKRTKYTSLKAAQRKLGLLTSDEPWLYYGSGKDAPDDWHCCSGYECGCGGITVRQQCEALRRDMPPLDYAKLEMRTVGEWSPVEQNHSGE